jgi:hypothetical protein
MSYLGYPPISPGFIDDTSLIVDGVIQTADIANDTITTVKIADSNITTVKIADGSVTLAKLDSGVQASITSVSLPLSGGTMTGNIAMGGNDISGAGDITASGTITGLDFNTTSDITLKHNLQPVSNPLEKISKLSGYTFNWNHNDKPAVGVMAQEVEKVFPEMVATGTDGYKRVNYDALVPVLIEAIKELSSKIKA